MITAKLRVLSIPTSIWEKPCPANLRGEFTTTVSTELGGEEQYLKNIVDGMRKSREIHIQQENMKIKRRFDITKLKKRN